MHGLQGVKQEEGFLRLLFRVVVEELKALLQEDHVHLLVIKPWRDETSTTIEGPFVRGQLRFINELRGRYGNAIAIHESVEPVGGWAAHRSEEVIKAPMNRRIRHGS